MSPVRYVVRLAAPHRHVVEIVMRFAPSGPTTDITMPAWCPGSYLIRDYARFVRDVHATGDGGEPRRVTKVDKSTWRVDTGGIRELAVRYSVYGHELTVRTNHIDSSHAFLHGP